MLLSRSFVIIESEAPRARPSSPRVSFTAWNRNARALSADSADSGSHHEIFWTTKSTSEPAVVRFTPTMGQKEQNGLALFLTEPANRGTVVGPLPFLPYPFPVLLFLFGPLRSSALLLLRCLGNLESMITAMGAKCSARSAAFRARPVRRPFASVEPDYSRLVLWEALAPRKTAPGTCHLTSRWSLESPLAYERVRFFTIVRPISSAMEELA
jgi:hypothetical protein